MCRFHPWSVVNSSAFLSLTWAEATCKTGKGWESEREVEGGKRRGRKERGEEGNGEGGGGGGGGHPGGTRPSVFESHFAQGTASLA